MYYEHQLKKNKEKERYVLLLYIKIVLMTFILFVKEIHPDSNKIVQMLHQSSYEYYLSNPKEPYLFTQKEYMNYFLGKPFPKVYQKR